MVSDEYSPHTFLNLRGGEGTERKGWGKVHVWSGSATLPAVRSPSDEIVWRSQCGQDKLLVQEIFNDDPRNHYFIDLASNDPVHLSNSYVLETEYGWKGICIEANPVHYIGLSKRKCIAVSAGIYSSFSFYHYCSSHWNP